MTTEAIGTFEVKLAPLSIEEPTLGRMSIDKVFSGALTGTSKGEMLTAASVVKGSAGYVAVERVTGTLDGRSGTFSLMHMGIMNRGAPQLSITVVPDSGTAGLDGLSGSMTIDRSDGKHAYGFTYALPEAR